ncbi:MAG: DUF3383 family protein [Candidatus Thorarchaeota archaeon]
MAMDRQAVVTNVHRAFRTSMVRLNSAVALISDSGSISVDKKLYKDLDGVADDFATTTEFYQLAKAYFAKGADELWAVPMTQQTTAETQGTATLNTIDAAAVTTLIAISDGEFTISVDGTPQDVTTVDLTAATDVASIATILDGEITGASVTSLGDILTITSDTSGVLSTIGSITPVSGGTGTDLSTSLIVQTAQNGIPSSASWDIVGKLTDLENDATDGFGFIGVLFDKTISSAEQIANADLAKFAFKKEFAVFLDTSDVSTKTGTSATIVANRDFYKDLSGKDKLANGNMCFFYTDVITDYVAAGYLGELLAYDIGERAPKFIKPIESKPITLTGSELGMILGSNVNVYTGTNERTGRAFIKEGTSLMDNVYIDTLLGGIWMQVQIENAIYDILETQKVPMNIDGYTLLETTVLPIFKQGIAQGIINGQAGGQTVFAGDSEATNIFGYAIKFRAGDVANREVVGQYCYYDNIAAHFVTNEVCIKMIEG